MAHKTTFEDLFSMNYIYISGKEEKVTLNIDRLTHASKDTISEILSIVKEKVSESNFIQIVNSLTERNVPNEYCDNSYVKKDNMIEIKESVFGKFTKQIAIKYSFVARKNSKNSTTKNSASNDAQKLENAINKLFEEKRINKNSILEIAKSFEALKENNILISYDNTNVVNDTRELCKYDKKGLLEASIFKAGKLLKSISRRAKGSSVENFYDLSSGILTRTITRKTEDNFSISIQDDYTYENGALVEINTTRFIQKSDAIRKTAIIKVELDKDENVKSAVVKDPEFGKCEYQFNDKEIVILSNDKKFVFDSTKDVVINGSDIEALKETDFLEKGLAQLEKYVSKVKLPYKKIYNQIYTIKQDIGMQLFRAKSVIAYIADKGNITFYDRTGTRVAYFPRSVMEDKYKEIMAGQNIYVEQRIKSSQNQKAIKNVYWLGTQEGQGKGIYAFYRVIRALCKNPFTPTEILSDITDKILSGKYNRDYLQLIAANPSMPTECLQKILNNKPSLLVIDIIRENPNRPDGMA